MTTNRLDRRSITSRANLADHIPERIDPVDDTVVLSVRLSRRERDRLDREADAEGNTLSQHVRNLLMGYYERDAQAVEVC